MRKREAFFGKKQRPSFWVVTAVLTGAQDGSNDP